MPRDGSGIYSVPPGTKGVPDTTIESAKFNSFIDDMVADANAARPITAGGTGAKTVIGAADALSPAHVTVASASLTDLGATTSPNVIVTGNATITGFGVKADGAKRWVKFSGTPTLTHSTSLVLPASANITAVAGDTALFVSRGGGVWECLSYQRASGQAVIDGFPTGAIVMRFGPLLTGFIAWGEGGTFNRATYPALAAWLDANGASLGLTPAEIAAGTIPDWRDYSPRTAGGALGPVVGAKQEDAFQGFKVQIDTNTVTNVGSSSGSGSNHARATANPATGTIVTDGVNGTPRIASETRGKAFGVRWQIKAFGAAADAGTVVISALAADVQSQGNRITSLEARPFAKEYVSAEQMITLGGTLTLAHGLGAVPKSMCFEAVCAVAEGGYAVGETMVLTGTLDHVGSASTYGQTVRRTATNIIVRFGGNGFVGMAMNPSSGAIFTPNAANWRLVARAWA